MKKVSMLVLLAILASTLMMAAIPTKNVRLTMINKSGYDVYMKLEGSQLTEAFYYLTVPSGDRDVPTVKIFTVMADVYTRTTWQCNGIQSSGNLVVDGNLRLTFSPCYEMPCGFSPDWRDQMWVDRCTGEVVYLQDWIRKRHAGEPRMEKVTYFKIFQYGPVNSYNIGVRQFLFLFSGYWNFGGGTWFYRIRSYQLPYGCAWRYQY